MKTLLFSLLFIGGVLPNVVFGETAVSQNELLDYLQKSTETPLTEASIKSFINTAKGQENYKYLNEEDEFYLTFKEGQTTANFIQAIKTENERRKLAGNIQGQLPDPTISTTQVPPNNGEITRTPLSGSAPKITDPSQWLEPTKKSSDSKTPTNISILDQIVPSNNFGGKFGAQPLSKILNQLFWIGLVGAVVLALVMVIRGGIEYMTIDSISGKESGKNRIQAALGGLLLAFSAILILNTINPGLTKLSIVFQKLESIKPVGFTGVITSGTRTGNIFEGNDYSTINNAIIPTGNGYEVTPGRVAIDTDGSQKPPFNDPDWQNQTSLAGLNANTDNYVVVPIGSNIPLGTRVQMYNENTGKTAWGIVGDRGPSPNGYGELSLNAARELGAWTDGMGNSANQHKIKYTYYTNEKK